MAFLSEILGKPVWDIRGERVGRCVDLLASNLEAPFPVIEAMAVKDGDRAPRFIAGEQIGYLQPAVLLTVDRRSIRPFEPSGNELHLARQVLDRQIVDTEGRRVVRANDVQITRMGDRFRLTGIDVGLMGLIRRLGIERPVRALLLTLKRPLPETILPWEDVATLHREGALQLRVSREKVSKLHPADIADIVSELDRPTGQALIESLDDELLADALEESSVEFQEAVLTHLKPERAADVLEEMAPDEAADLLADLPKETVERILRLMERKDAEDVRRLLAYPEDTAGGIMTTEFATVPEGLTCGEALDLLRRSEEAQEDEAMYYVYVVDENRVLKGVLSLRDLVMAPPDAPVAEHMQTHLITAGLLTPQEEVAHLVAKYDLLAVPVVDENGVLHGIVTVDDAIDAMLPTAWKKRLPRFY